MAGYPCGHPAKNFGQALQILEKQAFWNGHPARTSMKKLRSEKLRADFPFPKKSQVKKRPVRRVLSWGWQGVISPLWNSLYVCLSVCSFLYTDLAHVRMLSRCTTGDCRRENRLHAHHHRREGSYGGFGQVCHAIVEQLAIVKTVWQRICVTMLL